MSNLCPKRKIFFLATALYAWGCAGGPPATPLSTTRVEAQAQVVRETFDPRTLEEDLLLISPTFVRTTLHAKAQEMPVIPFETSEPEPQTSTEVVTSAPTRPIASPTTKSYRVQLLALSNETVALERQSELELALKVSVYIEPRRQLFMVQAGDFATPTEAEALKKRAIQLGPDYDDAYIASVEQITPAETAESDQTPTPIATDEPIELVKAFGWRVLLDQFLSHEEADRLKRKAMARLNRRDIDVTFKAPWYKVEVGHFEAESEAQSSAEKIKSRYPNALKVRSQILIPKRD